MAAGNRPIHLQWRPLALVAAGGAVGAASREALSLAIPAVGGIPLAIAIINIAGAFLLGLLYEAVARRDPGEPVARNLKLLLGTGFCGGFTTYSTLAVDTALLNHHGQVGTAVLYAVGTVLLGAVATWLGIVAGSRGNNRRTASGAPATVAGRSR
ncbi:fluoride efflux transporter CrcB [Arthrobacter sp. 35W]|uniref:fluoride efflux transporter CrcB n=1 Tax=Arthrobacter sp. 35W TaxID=1132441 RepID=UPI00040A314B|nr:fluoride efflux transporter CrcB [Arthrobacter sp. 35W]